MFNIPKCLVTLSSVVLICLYGGARLHAQEFRSDPWTILQSSANDKNSDRRTQAVRALGLIPDNPRAVGLAEHALDDPNAGVRRAAIAALGDMNSRPSLPKIKALLEEPQNSDAKTVATIAAVLKKFNDPQAFKIYCEFVSGQRKGANLLDGIKDKRALEAMGVESALGFVPFASYGLGAYHYFKQNATANANVDAIAASALAEDSDETTERALIHASLTGNETVQLAALHALAQRGDLKAIPELDPLTSSKRTRVRYTAAAAIIHLQDLQSNANAQLANANARR